MDKLNLNSTVKIKLTKVGFKELENQWEQIRADHPKVGEHTPPVVDEDGYSTMQLHSVMVKFGHLIVLGKELPFETDILVETTKEE